jgi:hypothetical protein
LKKVHDPGKIKVVKSMSWPLAIMVSVAMLVIGTTALLNKDVAAVTGSILTLLIAFGVAELREIKTNTNGSNEKLMSQNQALMTELTESRQNQQQMMAKMLSLGITPPGATVITPQPPQANPQTTTVVMPASNTNPPML